MFVILSLAGERKAYPLLATEFDEQASGFSPDGRWFLYTSTNRGAERSTRFPFPGPGGKWQVSTSGALAGSWHRGGKEILA